LGEQDRSAIRLIQERYGVATDSDAIRLAVRVLAESRALDIRTLDPLRVSAGKKEQNS
jgi:hypothetical protein